MLFESTEIPAGADSPISAGFRKTTQFSARAAPEATNSTRTTNHIFTASSDCE
jgi:hypothetical protein